MVSIEAVLLSRAGTHMEETGLQTCGLFFVFVCLSVFNHDSTVLSNCEGEEESQYRQVRERASRSFTPHESDGSGEPSP